MMIVSWSLRPGAPLMFIISDGASVNNRSRVFEPRVGKSIICERLSSSIVLRSKHACLRCGVPGGAL